MPLAAARPCSDQDMTLWDGVIGAEMDVTHLGLVTVPLHFLIDFPEDYPNSAPSIGFSFDFDYTQGASYVMSDGRLKGKKVICLDILGNFGGIHTEWKTTVGSGWSPAYTVSTLLIQLQSVLSDVGQRMSQQNRDVTYQCAVRFCERNPGAVLEILDAEEIREQQERRRREGRLLEACSGDEALAGRVADFSRVAGLCRQEAQMEALLALLADVARVARGSPASGAGDNGGATVEPQPAVAVDANICCWSTGKLYTEALLGVGLSRRQRNLATAGELLSAEAFEGGLRQNTDKSPFEFFLPVWINEAHAAGRQEWRSTLLSCCSTIGSRVYDMSCADDAALEVFPRMINQTIVEMMRPDADKSEAIATFEALCNFWRTFRWLVDNSEPLRRKVGTALARFVAKEGFRHKDTTPDLGALLVLWTVLQGGEGCPARKAFINAYVDENSLRWVMWWQRAGVKPEGPAVFEATKVSREILMFQMMVVDVVIGHVPETLKEIEATNCKLPARLERLQREWRERKKAVDSWQAFFGCVGADRPQGASSADWIADCVRRAAEKGPKYVSGKGGGKGSGKGGPGTKGQGKGKGKF